MVNPKNRNTGVAGGHVSTIRWEALRIWELRKTSSLLAGLLVVKSLDLELKIEDVKNV